MHSKLFSKGQAVKPSSESEEMRVIRRVTIPKEIIGTQVSEAGERMQSRKTATSVLIELKDKVEARRVRRSWSCSDQTCSKM
jgi:hypothetical protein